MRGLGKKFIELAVVTPARYLRPLRAAIVYAANRLAYAEKGPYAIARYANLRERFIGNSESSVYDAKVRREIADRFEVIDEKIEIASTPTDGLFLAETLLSVDADGDVVECGCFNGGSTAKLSIVAKVTGRRLVVFDSFEGLPEVDEYNRRDYHLRHDREYVSDWSAGRYASAMETVTSNVRRYGEIEVCDFVKGWFNETLTDENVPSKIALAFADVDIPSSARDCLLGLWPRLAPHGVMFSHDAAYVKVLQALADREVWERLGEFPPIFWGGGFGFGDTSPHLGMAVKGDVDAAYINNLMIEK